MVGHRYKQDKLNTPRKKTSSLDAIFLLKIMPNFPSLKWWSLIQGIGYNVWGVDRSEFNAIKVFGTVYSARTSGASITPLLLKTRYIQESNPGSLCLLLLMSFVRNLLYWNTGAYSRNRTLIGLCVSFLEDTRRSQSHQLTDGLVVYDHSTLILQIVRETNGAIFKGGDNNHCYRNLRGNTSVETPVW